MPDDKLKSMAEGGAAGCGIVMAIIGIVCFGILILSLLLRCADVMNS